MYAAVVVIIMLVSEVDFWTVAIMTCLIPVLSNALFILSLYFIDGTIATGLDGVIISRLSLIVSCLDLSTVLSCGFEVTLVHV